MIPAEAVEAAAIAAQEEYAKVHGWGKRWTAIARAALEASAPYVPRVITGYEDLEGLPVETVIRTNLGTVREKNSLGYWYAMGDEDANGIEMLAFPATIIYQP